MPELPEIEHLRRTLTEQLLGRRVQSVHLHRPDIVRCTSGQDSKLTHSLLSGATIAELRRHGKQLAILADDRRALVVRLGMSGQLIHLQPGQKANRKDHIHCSWRLADGAGQLIFRDPRRFGGLFPYDSADEVMHVWALLGPDAARIRSQALTQRLRATTRSIKAALLDQKVIAGIGNIYADEALHLAGIHPVAIARDLDAPTIERLSTFIRQVLAQSIRRGGTTFRDYVDGNGSNGRNGTYLHVYSRAGAACKSCGRSIESIVIAQRTTCFCPACQPSPNGTL